MDIQLFYSVRTSVILRSIDRFRTLSSGVYSSLIRYRYSHRRLLPEYSQNDHVSAHE